MRVTRQAGCLGGISVAQLALCGTIKGPQHDRTANVTVRNARNDGEQCERLVDPVSSDKIM